MNRIVLMVLKNFYRVPALYWKLCHYAKHTDKYSEEEKYAHIQKILKIAVESGNIDLTVRGLENIPEENGFHMYANHQGLFDILAIAATCPKPWAAVLKRELLKNPFLDKLAICTKSFPIDRDDIRQSMEVIMSVIDEVSAGRNYLIFPEGTRSKKGNEMLEFHRGSFKCPTKTKKPIVPIALIDCFKVLDQKGSKPVSVQLCYLKPIYYEEYKGLRTVELAELVRGRIEEAIAEYSNT